MVMVIVEVPEGVMMGGGGVGAVVTALVLPPLLPQPVTLIREQSRIAVRAPLHAKRLGRRASSNIRRFLAIISMSKVNARSGRTRIPSGGRKRLGIESGSTPAPLVDTVTVKGAGVPLAIATLAGAWHTAPSGAPLQTSDTVPL